MYRHILIPTDGSELSKVALEEGVALAKGLNAREHRYNSDGTVSTGLP
jgi:nucleotide-binding universal stress UspA family protein